MKIKIHESLEIGDGCRPFIIAEVGSNWTDFTQAKDSISMAKQCGADAVKFQLYDHKALYGVEGQMPGSLPLEWLPKLKEKAVACNIEFMCSAFSPELVEAVNPYVNIHKVASAELTHVRMLETLRRLGKPVILSTGASGEQDIRNALLILTGHGTTQPIPVILMYCVAAYPSQEINLDTINLLSRTFNLPCGFSDHTTNVTPLPKLALQHGACVLEKHFAAFDTDTPDRPHSLNPHQFKRMVNHIRGDVKPVLGAASEELEMLSRHNRRLVATQKLLQGTELTEGVNFGIYRSLKPDSRGFSPWMCEEVRGKRVRRVIEAGESIGPGDV